MARTGQPSRERIASAGRSLAILDVLASGGALGTNEIARRLGPLVEAPLGERVPATGHYRLGIRLVELATTVLARLDVRAVARPYLEALAAGRGARAAVP